MNKAYIKKIKKRAIIALSGLAILGIAAKSYTIIETGNVGVKYTLGEIDPIELKPGLHFLIPGIQKIDDVFTKTIMINYTNEKHKDTREIFYENSLKGEDTTGLEMAVDLVVEVDPQPNQMADMYIKVGREGFTKKVLQPIRGIVRRVLGQYNAEKIMSQRKQVENDIKKELEKLFANSPYYKLVSMDLKKIYLPKEVSKAIERVQLAKQHAKEQQQLIVANEAKAKSMVALAEGKAKSITVTAKANAERIAIEANAQAKANKVIAESLTPELIKLKAIQAWKTGGAQVPKFVTGATSPMNLLINSSK